MIKKTTQLCNIKHIYIKFIPVTQGDATFSVSLSVWYVSYKDSVNRIVEKLHSLPHKLLGSPFNSMPATSAWVACSSTCGSSMFVFLNSLLVVVCSRFSDTCGSTVCSPSIVVVFSVSSGLFSACCSVTDR